MHRRSVHWVPFLFILCSTIYLSKAPSDDSWPRGCWAVCMLRGARAWKRGYFCCLYVCWTLKVQQNKSWSVFQIQLQQMLISSRDNSGVLASACLYVSYCCCCSFVLQITPEESLESYLRECVGLLLTTASHPADIRYNSTHAILLKMYYYWGKKNIYEDEALKF